MKYKGTSAREARRENLLNISIILQREYEGKLAREARREDFEDFNDFLQRKCKGIQMEICARSAPREF